MEFVNFNYYTLKIGEYGGTFSYKKFPIPKDVKFFQTLNDNLWYQYKDCHQYVTVVKWADYNDLWLQYISEFYNINIDFIGEYAIVTLDNIHEDSEKLPLVDRKEWFKKNSIDFSKYTILICNKRGDRQEAYKIKDFISSENINVVNVVLRDKYDDREYFGIYSSLREAWKNIDPNYFKESKRNMKLLEGEEGVDVWKDMINEVLNHSYYNS